MEIVNLVNMCSNLGALPNAGGVLDQDAYTMFLFELVISAQQERQRADDERSRRATQQQGAIPRPSGTR
jgi:hypothetical protein